MKKIYCAAAVFLLVFAVQSCSLNQTSDTADSHPARESVSVTVSLSETSLGTSAPITSSASSAVSSSSAAVSSASVSVSGIPEQTADYDAAELSMLEIAGNPDYSAEAAIPYVAWTEINLDKTMYAVSRCFGYEFALKDASAKMIYDAGSELNVIARTSTGYYRIEGNFYIPCEYLDNYPDEDTDPAAATSCTVPAPPVTTAALTAAKK